MTTYETLFITLPNLSETEEATIVGGLAEIVDKGGGTMVVRERLGRRRLAYPIERHDDGVYTLFLYDAEPDVPRELERRIRLSDKVLRWLTVRLEDAWVADAKEKAIRDAEARAQAEAARAAAAQKARAEAAAKAEAEAAAKAEAEAAAKAEAEAEEKAEAEAEEKAEAEAEEKAEAEAEEKAGPEAEAGDAPTADTKPAEAAETDGGEAGKEKE